MRINSKNPMNMKIILKYLKYKQIENRYLKIIFMKNFKLIDSKK